jgi:hypothetical protein
METIQKVVADKVKSMVGDGIIQKAIEDGVSAAITKAISNQFQSYGAITKLIEKAIEDGLKINLNDVPFETYNEQMLVAVKSKLGTMFQGAAADKFMAEMDKILAPAPSEMPIKEFVETVAGFWKSDEPWDADDLDEEATVDIEKNEYGSVSLNMWKQKENSSGFSTRPNSADLQLYIIKGKIRINHRQEYNPICFHEHEAFVFKLYAAGTILTGIDSFNADDCDLALKETDY